MSIQIRRLPPFLLPILSLMLSLPLLLGILAADALVGYEAITGHTQFLRSLAHSLQPPWFAPLVLYALYGPLLACLLCLMPAPPPEQNAMATWRLRRPAQRARSIGLLCALATQGLLVLTGAVFGIARGGT